MKLGPLVIMRRTDCSRIENSIHLAKRDIINSKTWLMDERSVVLLNSALNHLTDAIVRLPEA